MKVDMARFHIATTLLSLALLSGSDAFSQSPHTGKPKVPKLWDDAAMSKLEVPLANPMGSPKHVSSDYYYRIPTRPIYKQYPVYAPGREPAGYMDRLKHLEPVIVWDDSRHKPKLKTEADWVKAGEIVFSAPIIYSIDKGVFTLADVQNKAWYEKSGMPLTSDGVMPFLHYVNPRKRKGGAGKFFLRYVPHPPDGGWHSLERSAGKFSL